MALVQCTFYGNTGAAGSAISYRGVCSPPATIENTIIAFNLGAGEAIEAWDDVQLVCCDIYGNEGGDWTGRIEDQLGVNGNISADPLFCDAPNGDLRLDADSPCGPDGDCGLIGAWPVGCALAEVPEIIGPETEPAHPATWGLIKGLFRE